MTAQTLFWVGVWAVFATVALLYIRAELKGPSRGGGRRADRRSW